MYGNKSRLAKLLADQQQASLESGRMAEQETPVVDTTEAPAAEVPAEAPAIEPAVAEAPLEAPAAEVPVEAAPEARAPDAAADDDVSLEAFPFLDKVKRLEKKAAKLDDLLKENAADIADTKRILAEVKADAAKGDAAKFAKKIAHLEATLKELETVHREDILKIQKETNEDLAKAKAAKPATEALGIEGEGDESANQSRANDEARGMAEQTAIPEGGEAPPATDTPIEGAPAETPVEGTLDAAPEPTAEDTYTAVVDADREVEATSSALEQLQEISAGLETIYSSLRDAVSEGGLQPQTAKWLNIAVEAYAGRLSLDQPVVPAMESFGGASSRLNATQISMEGVGDVLKELWAKIVEAAKQLWSQVADFTKKILVASERLAGDAQKLGEKAKAVKGATARSATIELSQANANKLASDNKVDMDIRKSLGALITLAKEVVQFDKAGHAALAHEHDMIVDAVVKGSGKEAAEMLKKSEPVLPPVFKKITDATHFGGRVDHVVYGTDFVIGRTMFVMDQVNFSVFGIETVGYGPRKWLSDKAQDVSELKVATLSIEQIEHICMICSEISEIAAETEHLGSELIKDADRILGDLKTPKEDLGDHVQLTVLLKAYRQRAVSLNRCSALVMGHLATTARAALAMAEQSLAQYGEAEAKAPAAAEPAAA